jgi:hypothetical protein
MDYIEKSILEKTIKRCDFSIKYVSLPCLVISLVAMVAAGVAGDKSLLLLNGFMGIFNVLVYILNTYIRNQCINTLNILDDLDRLQKIRDLNPNKR